MMMAGGCIGKFLSLPDFTANCGYLVGLKGRGATRILSWRGPKQLGFGINWNLERQLGVGHSRAVFLTHGSLKRGGLQPPALPSQQILGVDPS